MTKKASITAVGHYLPETILSNAELEKTLDTTDDWIRSRTGIIERRVVSKDEATSHMSINSAKLILEKRELSASDIDVIIVATVTPDMFFPSTAALVQNAIGAKNAWAFDLNAAAITTPSKLGIETLSNYPLERLIERIDWTPFFMTWEMKGRFPNILDHHEFGTEARKLYNDALRLLDRILAQNLLQATGIFGLFPANSDGDDLVLYREDQPDEVLTVLHTLRQQMKKRNGQPNLCLADFVAPRTSGTPDYVGAFAVTAGFGVEKLAAGFEADLDDYSSILVKALADRLAEAFAEELHERVRKEFWGYALTESLSNEELIQEDYRGIRPAPGYPAYPDHTEKSLLFSLLGAERQTGISLTENFAMTPAASVSGLFLAHPEAHYFGVGRLLPDQVKDYAQRKGLTTTETERWLGPNLGYTPK